MDEATARQVEAADPIACTWLSANAGSGKTRVLTDRVARLLLAGVDPGRILCLTYTRAAAGEMQNRLFARLGGWAMLDPAALARELASLGVTKAPGAADLAKARRLFARAIETPGGLKIQTIHAFCAGLLRRFPLEAGVSPAFSEIDERSARRLQDDTLDDLARTHPADFDALARHLGGADLADLASEISRHRKALAQPLTRDAALALFGLPPGYDAAALRHDAFAGGEAALLSALCPALAAGSTNDQKAAARLTPLAGADPGLDALPVLEGVLLTGGKAKAPFSAKIGSFPTKATRDGLGPLLAPLDALMARIEAARPRRIALAAAERMHDLHRFAARYLPELDRRKAARGWLDFDDLIQRAVQLLTDPAVAQWVLFKLDGGVDHILVDEAQDTSPEQWRVIESLTQEFTAGEGAAEPGRTIFVVGDKKQSIYSFQGADLRRFEAMHRHFADRLGQIGVGLRDLLLEHSFRSSEAILRLVDLTFDERRDLGLGGAVKHLAFHGDMPGRVDLWPPEPPGDKPADREWFDPVDIVAEEHHTTRLAQRIAGQIGRMIAEAMPLPQPQGGARPVQPGDFLILVRRRGPLFHRIITACKAAGLPMAGADRMKLGAELAVRDLTALMAFLATPEDDLSLAAALRSPLLGWSEDALFRLAHDRGAAWLWEVLRQRRDVPETLEILTDLRDRADFLRPYDLAERLLTRHGGRQRLLARLGSEAEEGIDAFLTQALAYERTEVPSLTGFLVWLGAEDVEVKRRPDAAGNRIRVMTVHGAKGLESPIVILPDTAPYAPPDRNTLLPLGNGRVAWAMPADETPPPLAEARAARQQTRQEEDARLLYVAMTRAESWLIVAAAGETDKPDCWYAQVAAGMVQAGAVPQDFGADAPGLRLQHGHWPEAAAPAPEAAAPKAVALPDWAGRPASAAPHAEAPLSPSDLGGAKVMPGAAEAPDPDGDGGLRRGHLLHLLLEHLPQWPTPDWPGIAAALIGAEAAADPGAGPPPDPAALLQEARAVLSAPDLAFLFAPDSLAEVEICADLAGRRMLGTIDRLLLAPDRVLAVDYKSNAVVPDRPEDVPEGLMRQMAAYDAALRQVYPDRRVEVALLWTAQARLMPLPPALLHSSLAGLPA